jgi:hypothetical protein
MSPQAGFILQDQVVPRLQAVIPRSVLCVGSEDHEELVQDATCLAARIMHNAEINKKKITPSNAAFYALQHCKSGRRAVGNSAVDVHGSSTQLNGHSRLESLEQVVAVDEITGGEIYFHDVLSNDQEDPGTKAARKMDWADFMAGLSPEDQAIVRFMIEGQKCSTMASKLRVHPSTIQHRKHQLGKAILEYHGSDILLQVQRSPRWKNDLAATKEKMACKHERSH